MRSVLATRVACAILGLSLALGCQGPGEADGTDDPPADTPSSSESTSGAGSIFAKDIEGVEVCPAASELESLPKGVSFAYGEEISSLMNPLDEKEITCEYGIYLKFPEYDRISEDYISLRLNVSIRNEEVRASSAIKLEYEPLSYFADWQNASWTYDESQGTDICVSSEEQFVTSQILESCREGSNTRASAYSGLVSSTGNLQVSLQGSYFSPGSSIEDSQEEALGAAMTELAGLAMGRIPLEQD
ncbi:hypothetical protein [Glycomyces algeriensis]|uniref:DUF3558 domain-containing protein n=1 Tax=Glycomyces algeriensis TaxID=256037 RepID=A0A9W6LEQ9_9ACTN|nr:hypothetical protein [Glycomyces algeriensis]MDA1366988.1 hypothetical protein [Glycomyces algeriensis]MDR7352625.1 hypothetical protein [Glycomyces algeriensis]GLI40305.1 hypothetical protein GALLR39Z86_01550 [Glycomyces algeriensis]